MFTKKDIRNIILFVIAALVITVGLIWIIIEFAPYLIVLIAFPAWLISALADGANVK